MNNNNRNQLNNNEYITNTATSHQPHQLDSGTVENHHHALHQVRKHSFHILENNGLFRTASKPACSGRAVEFKKYTN